jgi:transposase
LLPPARPRRSHHPRRKPVEDRKALTGILFVLKTDIPWEDLPREMGCGWGMTCRRRPRDESAAGVWFQLPQVMLTRTAGASYPHFPVQLIALLLIG